MFGSTNTFGSRLVACGAAALIMLGTASANAEELRLGTASQGGAFYPVGQAISTLVSKYAEGTTMVPIVTGGSVQNPRLISSGEVEIGITNNNLAALANKGLAAYKDAPMKLKAIGSLHPSILHMMTLDGSPINSIADLKGKRVAVGPAGGGTIPFLGQVLGLEGLSIEDITPSFLSYSDGFSQLADGNVDAAFALSGYPAGAVMQAQANKKLKFIKFSDAQLATALEKFPAYDSITVPKDVYSTDDDGVVLGVANMLVVDESMDDELAYQIAKAVYSHMDEFIAENALAKQVDPAKSLNLTISLHPGAERFFKE